MNDDEPWYSAKVLFLHNNSHYEERIIVLNALDMDDAERKAISEAKNYASNLDNVEYKCVIDIFHIFGSAISNETEVYSVVYESTQQYDELLESRYGQSK